MRVLTNVSFLSLEFDFGAKGRIDANVFVEMDNNGELQKLEHKAQLHEVSFHNFLSPEQIIENTQVGDSFSTFIQSLRKLIILKVASDLDLDVVGDDYTIIKPLSDSIKSLENSQSDQDALIMKLLLGGVSNE